MQIQSLSVVVPNRQCINHCASCPSRMHDNNYPMLFDIQNADFGRHAENYLKRLKFARDNGCNTMMLTGTSEPQQNRQFLAMLGMMLKRMKNPFKSIEMQCTGAMLDENYLTFLRDHVGLTTLALSVFSLESDENRVIVNPPEAVKLEPLEVAKMAESMDLNIRICLNLTKHFDRYTDIGCLFYGLKNVWMADQVTLRVLYAGGDDCPENIWVRENRASQNTVNALKNYIISNGTSLGRLPYGAVRYAIDGMSVVLDDDSMGKEMEVPDSYKYLILRPDCRLYSSWDDPASLVL